MAALPPGYDATDCRFLSFTRTNEQHVVSRRNVDRFKPILKQTLLIFISHPCKTSVVSGRRIVVSDFYILPLKGAL